MDPVFCARAEGEGACDRIAHGGCLGQDLPHPRVRLEGLALDDPDRGEFAGNLGIECLGGLVAHQVTRELVERTVVGIDGVHGETGSLDEPPAPRSGPPMPESVTHRAHMSFMNVSVSGGLSTTSGPPVRSADVEK